MENRRSEIIQVLIQNQVISGEEISRKVGISRTAVWKHIKILQKKGYDIHVNRQQGYQLRGLPDIPVEEIQFLLHPSCIGSKLLYFPSLTSTNEYVNKLVKLKYPEGTVVIAGTQSLGRGRKQRLWVSPKGGLWFSFFIRPQLPPQKAMIVTMATSIAIAKVISSTTKTDVRIKWPNDVLINGKKVCGILTELSAEMDQINYMIIGIGLNVNNELPDNFHPTATSLKEVMNQVVSLKQLLLMLLSSLDEWYKQVKLNNNTFIQETWLSLTDIIGKQIEIKEDGFITKGVVKGITENGGLLVETEKGILHIVTGDISYI